MTVNSALLLFAVAFSMINGAASQGGCAWVGPNSTCPAHCTWDCGLGLCYDASCPQLNTAATCQALSGCAWVQNKCRDYNLQYGSFPNCAVAQTAASCGGNCAWSTQQSKCVAKANACAWAPQRSSTACPDGCTYGQAIGYCYDATCAARSTSSDCSAGAGCAWSNGYCYDYNLQYSGFACSLASEASECPSSRCHWDAETGVCVSGGVPAGSTLPPAPSQPASPGGCAWISNPTAESCPAHCTFDASLNLCFDATCIHLHTPAQCATRNGCSWSGNQCRDYNLQFSQLSPCNGSTSVLHCGGSNCQWKWSTAKCIGGPSSSACAWLQQSSAAVCPDRCSFNALTGHCFATTCATVSTQCACSRLASAGCAWYNNRCRDYNVQYGSYACADAKSAAECGRTCAWDSATSTCSA